MVAGERILARRCITAALKSGAIIIRSRVTYQSDHPLYASASYATANVDWPAGQQVADRLW